MVIFIESVAHVFKKLHHHSRYLFLAMFFDFLFFLFFGLTTFAAIPAQVPSRLKEGAVQVLQSLVSEQTEFIKLAFAVAAILYGLWILFGGASWFLAEKMLGSKESFLKFSAKFSIISAIWFIITTALFASVRSVLLNFVMLYFILISLALVPYASSITENFRKSFTYGIKKITTFIPMYAVIVAILALSTQIAVLILTPFSKQLITRDYGILMIALIRFIITAPFIALARMYLIDVSRNVIRS